MGVYCKIQTSSEMNNFRFSRLVRFKNQFVGDVQIIYKIVKGYLYYILTLLHLIKSIT
jgi:hypothetical protein